MKILILACLVSLTLAVPVHHPHNYLAKVGIPLANQIRAAEKAMDFDGARIVGGTVSRLGLVPYMGGLLITLKTGFRAVCGSSLLTNTHVVTAAHCADDGWNQASQFVVVLGSLTLFSGGTRRTTTDVVVHEGWNAPFSFDNDIAVIRINSVAYTNNIRQIALPSGSMLTFDFTNSIALTAGWGRQSDTAAIPTSQRLHATELQVLADAHCRAQHGDAFTPSMLCARAAGGRGTCHGDAGGPLVYNDVLIGVNSIDHHADGCLLGYPVVFTRVSSYLPWILNNMY